MKPIATLFLDPTSPLYGLYNQAKLLQGYQQTVSSCLADAMVSHVKVSSYRNNTLHLTIDNAHWATRLRYIEQDLIKKLKNHTDFHRLNRVRYNVRPNYNPPSNTKAAKSISSKNAEHIASVAKYIEDEHLRKALISLSKAKPGLKKT